MPGRTQGDKLPVRIAVAIGHSKPGQVISDRYELIFDRKGEVIFGRAFYGRTLSTTTSDMLERCHFLFRRGAYSLDTENR